MDIVPLLLQIAALVFLFFGAFGLFPSAKVNWPWLGMFLWLLSLMVGGIHLHATQGTS